MRGLFGTSECFVVNVHKLYRLSRTSVGVQETPAPGVSFCVPFMAL